jgi:hypothetical protein
MNSRFEPIWSIDKRNIVKIVSIAANRSSAKTQKDPFCLLTILIGNGFTISNKRKITNEKRTDSGECDIVGNERINHIPSTSSITMIDASLPCFLSKNAIDQNDTRNIKEDNMNN